MGVMKAEGRKYRFPGIPDISGVLYILHSALQLYIFQCSTAEAAAFLLGVTVCRVLYSCSRILWDEKELTTAKKVKQNMQSFNYVRNHLCHREMGARKQKLPEEIRNTRKKSQKKSLVAGKRVQAYYHIRDVEKQPLVFCSSSSVFLFIFVLLFNLAG